MPDLWSIKIFHRLDVYAMIGAGLSAVEYDLQTFEFCRAIIAQTNCTDFTFEMYKKTDFFRSI